MSQQIAAILYWVGVGVVVLGSLIGLVSALRRRREKAAKFDLAFGAAGLVAYFAIAIWIKGTPSGLVIMAVAAVAGVALGFFAAKARMPLALLTWACITFALIMVVFGEPGAQSWGFYAMGLGFGVATGQGVKRLVSGNAQAEKPVAGSSNTAEMPEADIA